MDVTPLIRRDAQVIQSYAGGRFRVSGQLYEGAVIVFPDRVVVWEGPVDIAALEAGHFEALAAEKPDVVLLGTGKSFQLMPSDLRKSLKDKGLSVDFMDTGAACRTYNVLLAEGRRVAAVLLPA